MEPQYVSVSGDIEVEVKDCPVNNGMPISVEADEQIWDSVSVDLTSTTDTYGTQISGVKIQMANLVICDWQRHVFVAKPQVTICVSPSKVKIVEAKAKGMVKVQGEQTHHYGIMSVTAGSGSTVTLNDVSANGMSVQAFAGGNVVMEDSQNRACTFEATHGGDIRGQSKSECGSLTVRASDHARIEIPLSGSATGRVESGAMLVVHGGGDTNSSVHASLKF